MITDLMLKETCYVSSLDLRQNQLKNEGIEVLARAVRRTNSLVHLDVRSTAFSKEGADQLFKALARNQTLTCLRIGCIRGMHRNFLSSKALEHLVPYLRNTVQLTFIDLRGAGIGNEAFRVLAEGVKKCKSLRMVDVALNNIDSGCLVPVIEMIANSSIKRLDLSQNPLGNTFILEMAKRIPMERFSLTHLCLSHCDFTSPALCQLFITLKKDRFLEHLEARGATYGEQDLKSASWFLTSSSTLKNFDAAHCGFGDVGVKRFAEGFVPAYMLQRLEFCGNKITDVGATFLAERMLHVNLKHLKWLGLSENGISVLLH